MVFEQVCTDLEAEGYEVQSYVLPAAGVNAPHQRYRVWVVAYSSSNGLERGRFREDRCEERELESQEDKWERLWADTWGIGAKRFIANAVGTGSGQGFCPRSPELINEDVEERGVDTNPGSEGLQGGAQERGQARRGQPRDLHLQDWQRFPVESPLRVRNDGFSLDSLRQRIREDSMGVISEKEIDQIISKAFTNWSNNTIKAGGNAIVPPLLLRILKAIDKYQKNGK